MIRPMAVTDWPTSLPAALIQTSLALTFSMRPSAAISRNLIRNIIWP